MLSRLTSVHLYLLSNTTGFFIVPLIIAEEEGVVNDIPCS